MKESLQEATQRVLLEGYKNLNENKSKKVEAKLEDIQMEIYEMIQTARNVDKQDKETNIKETIYAMKLDYPEIDEKELSDYITKKADEIYAGDYDEKMESKQRDFKAEFLALPEKEQEKYKKCIPPLRRGLSNVEAETIAKERGLDAGILWWVTNIGQLTNFKESKKVEAEEDTTSAPDYLEKAFEVEVEYWLKALVDENSNDEIGKKAQEVLDDKAKMKSIVDELVNGSDDLWEDIHRRIEELAGLHYRESSRVNENKKVTEAVEEDKVNLYDTVWDQISCYDEEYAQEQGIDKLDDEDVYNIIAEIMSRPDVQDIIREEIEDYAGRKK